MSLVVVDAQDGVLGYVIARRMADEGEILNVGVAPSARRRGVGRLLVRKALERLGELGARSVYLEVRESNVAARELYREFGFVEVWRRAKYYQRPVEDAILLKAAIPAGAVTR